jgi:hypothetical protein
MLEMQVPMFRDRAARLLQTLLDVSRFHSKPPASGINEMVRRRVA